MVGDGILDVPKRGQMSKSVYKNYIKIVIILGIIAYIIMFVYTFFIQSIETLPLERGIVEDVNVTDGIITRTEEIVTLNIEDDIIPLVSEGERVSKGQALATIENSAIRNIQNKIEKLNEELENIITPNSFDVEVRNLNNEVAYLLNKIIKTDTYNSFGDILGYKNIINDNLQKKIYKISQVEPKNSEIINYITKLNKLEKELANEQTIIKSIMAGTVIYKLDGYEKILTTDMISSYTTESFDIPSGELVGTSKEHSFKIVDNLECYVTVVLDTNESELAYVDQKVTLRFPEIDTSLEVFGVIDYINFTPNGDVITFKINKGIEKILNYRKTKVEVVWDYEEGYKVPSNSIVKEGEKNKIYLYLGRNYVVEKYIEIKKQSGEYAIIEGTDGNKLYLYDSVILDSGNINLNKVLKY
jgi:biotin carboxyl carrier protein